MKKITIMSAIIMSTLISTPVSADIEDWLRKNFSSRDYVGDWLRDVFGPVQNTGEDFDSPSIQSKGYREAVEIMQEWPGPKGETMEVRQLCDGEKLLHVILETKSQKKTIQTCFEAK